MKFQESDDMRAPLAFLLGKLNFDKEFRNLQSKTRAPIRASRRSPRPTTCPIPRWSFWWPRISRIREVKVTGFDHSILHFTFDQERLDPPLDAKLFQFQAQRARNWWKRGNSENMADFVLKYADARGQIHQQVATAGSEKELRDKLFAAGLPDLFDQAADGRRGRRVVRLFGGAKKLNLEKFLIFNQQFVTLIRAGLPILKGLDLLAERLTDPKLGPYIKAVRDEVRNGTLLSEAFRTQGIFPKMYVTSVMAGEKSGSLVEVLDRYISYQKLALAVRKKVMVSLMYPCVLIVLVILLMVFLVTYVVPTFRRRSTPACRRTCRR